MAKKERVDSVAVPEAVQQWPEGTVVEMRNAPGAGATPEQLHLIPPPLQDKMVEQILERQAVFGF